MAVSLFSQLFLIKHLEIEKVNMETLSTAMIWE